MKLDDKTLQQMLERVTMNEEFMVSVADIKAVRTLAAGKTQPLTSANAPKKPPPASEKARQRRR